MNLRERDRLTIVSRFVRDRYRVKPQAIERVADGIASWNYRVRTLSCDLVVRCDGRRTVDHVRMDEAFQRAASLAGVPVPPGPMEIGSERGLVISGRPFVQGETLNHVGCVPRELFVVAGKTLASVHRTRAPVWREGFYEFVVADHDPRWQEIDRYALSSCDRARRELARQLASLIVSHRDLVRAGDVAVAHGDFTASNLLWSDAGELIVLDWEKSCIGSAVFDLGRAVFQLACGGRAQAEITLGQAVIDGYVARRRLSDEERRALPAMTAIAAAAFFLVDITLYEKARAQAGLRERTRRRQYFEGYCVPAYRCFSESAETLQMSLARRLGVMAPVALSLPTLPAA